MDRTERRPWSDLPPEILCMIGKRLDARMVVRRFCSVCSSFRSSIPPPRRDAFRFPLRIPHLQSASSSVILCKSAVCVLETPGGASDSGAPSPPQSRLLVKLQESSLSLCLQLLSLFSQRRITCLPRNFPKVIDSLESRIVEICREYRLEYNTSGIIPVVRKAMVSPDCVWTDIDELGVYSIVEDGRLAYWKYGDENWTYLDERYDDIIVYEGKVYVVDWSGAVSLIDLSFGTQKFSPSIYSDGGGGSCGNCKHLVVSGGDMYVVDRYFGGNLGRFDIDAFMDDFPYPSFNETFDFRVYRLDRRCGKWAEVRSLGNMAFFLSKHCSYAISMHELGGCNGNCIYFTENTDSDVNVFSLEDRTIKWLIISDFLMSTRGTSDLTQPKRMPSRSEEYVN